MVNRHNEARACRSCHFNRLLGRAVRTNPWIVSANRHNRDVDRSVSPEFREIFRLCAIQRLMQALGFYGFAAMVKDNKTFLNYVPAAMTSLRSLVGEIANLEELRVVLERQL